MKKELISVVIPCYNSSKYIRDAIESVINQTYDHLIKEIILVDDGSQDNTRQVINNYLDGFFIKYYFQKNKGPSSARNKGIEEASGKYVAFLDSDDVWEKKKIENEIDNIFSSRTQLLFSNVYVVNKKLEKLFKNHNKIPSTDEALIRELFLGNITMSTPTIIAEKKAIMEIGGFCEDLLHREDHFFLMKMVKNFNVTHLDQFNVLRRIRDSSLSQQELNNLSDPGNQIEINQPFLIKSLQEFPNLTGYRKTFLSNLYASVATKFLRAGKRILCWQNLMVSIFYKPGRLKNYFLLIASLLPIKYQKLKQYLL